MHWWENGLGHGRKGEFCHGMKNSYRPLDNCVYLKSKTLPTAKYQSMPNHLGLSGGASE